MFCKNCGTEVTDHNKFCGDCGVILSDDIQTPPMAFTDSIATCFNKYFVFEGKASRAEFWWFSLFCVLVTTATSIITDEFISYEHNQNLIEFIVSVVLIFPQIAVATRRLHDIGKSGWNQLWSLTIVGNIPLIIWWATKSKDNSNDEKSNFNFLESLLSFYFQLGAITFSSIIGGALYSGFLDGAGLAPNHRILYAVVFIFAILGYLIFCFDPPENGELVRYKKLIPSLFFVQFLQEALTLFPILWGIVLYQKVFATPVNFDINDGKMAFIFISLVTIAKSFYWLINTESTKIKAKTMWFLIDLVILSIIYLYIFKD